MVKYTYRNPGDYHVMAEPKTVGTLLKCLGKNQATMLKVAGAAAAASPKAAVAARPQCPPGWTLDAKSVNKQTGAFTCSAKPGTKAPAARLSCPGDLSYFENERTRLLGCGP